MLRIFTSTFSSFILLLITTFTQAKRNLLTPFSLAHIFNSRSTPSLRETHFIHVMFWMSVFLLSLYKQSILPMSHFNVFSRSGILYIRICRFEKLNLLMVTIVWFGFRLEPIFCSSSLKKQHSIQKRSKLTHK